MFGGSRFRSAAGGCGTGARRGGHLDGKGVGHDLHGVVIVSEAVDDGHVGEVREFQEVLVAVQARHDDVVELGHHARDVLCRLALADLNRVGVEVQRVAAHAEKSLHAWGTGVGRLLHVAVPTANGRGKCVPVLSLASAYGGSLLKRVPNTLRCWAFGGQWKRGLRFVRVL